MVRVASAKGIHVLLVLLLVSFATMLLLELTPGDPAYALLGEQATPEQVADVREALDLDRPLFERYGSWVGGIVQGDFGESIRTREPVMDTIRARLPVTLQIGLGAIMLALLLAVPLAVFSAYRAGRAADRAIVTGVSALISAPPYLIALLLSYLFAVEWRLFPVTGWSPLTAGLGDNLRSAALPTVALVVGVLPGFYRLLRGDLVTTLQSDFILAARAKGLSPRRILFRHALRPSSFSLITVAGLALGQVLTATILVESIFGLPGLGNLMIQSILTKDFVVVQGVVMFVAIVYVLANAGVDLLYTSLDPRVRSRAA
jgi:peptide/nickel transport system permease protein